MRSRSLGGGRWCSRSRTRTRRKRSARPWLLRRRRHRGRRTTFVRGRRLAAFKSPAKSSPSRRSRWARPASLSESEWRNGLAFSRVRHKFRLARLPKPERWELREVAIRLLLLPFILAPRPLEFAAARAITTYVLRPGSSVRKIRLRKLPPELAARAAIEPIEVVRGVEILVMRERILLMRAIVFPWWKRRVRLAGLAHVRAALEAGDGAILWVHQCVASNVAVKQAMFMAGYPLAHLSRPGHPFSSRPFGRRFVSPLLRRPEEVSCRTHRDRR